MVIRLELTSAAPPGTFSTMATQTAQNATAKLFNDAPKDIKRLQEQASKERRLKARAQWWANNSYRFPQKP